MFHALYDAGPNGLWVFLLVTLAMGGMAAWVSGKAVAETWRPFWYIPFYMVLLALSVRFIHYALFEEPLVSLKNFAVDFIVLMIFAVLGERTARSRQMATQYNWLFARFSPLGWRSLG